MFEEARYKVWIYVFELHCFVDACWSAFFPKEKDEICE